MKQWKTLIAATLTAVFAGAVLTGCGGSAELGPTPPKEAAAQLKFNGKDVPLYEYKGAELPKLQGYDTSLALTKLPSSSQRASSSERARSLPTACPMRRRRSFWMTMLHIRRAA